MADWEPVIGLEIHVQLQTKTKMFCRCELSFGEEPNTRICPVCLGLPGALPVANAEAVHYALMIGMALGCEIAPRSIFHRKNYFYPDSPKAYQISQYDIPICGAGRLGDIRIHRAHLEEDAAKLVHAGASGRIHSAESQRGRLQPLRHAAGGDRDRARRSQRPAGLRVAALLRVTLRQLGVSDVNMEEGSLRCDANVSIRPEGRGPAGHQDRAQEHEQLPLPRARGRRRDRAPDRHRSRTAAPSTQETLHFDPRSGSLSSLRSKEEAHDYRYFPEPDLVAIAPTEAMLARAREALPELPAERAARLESELGLAQDAARLLAFRPELGDLFEAAAKSAKADPRPVANWVTGELQAQLGDREPADTKLTPRALGALVDLVDEGAVSASAAKEVLGVLLDDGGDPAAIVDGRGLGKAGGDELGAIVDQALAENPDVVERIKGGNPKAVGAIVGAVMKATKGTADGGEVQRLVQERLGV